MLIKQDTLAAIAKGDVDRLFRRWKRPTVVAGGTLVTSVGVLAIDAVEAVTMASIRAADSARAGYATRAELLAQLRQRQGTVYSIRVRLIGPDPRIALRSTPLDSAAREVLEGELVRMPWARETLELIRANPAIRAEDLAAQMGLTKKQFKPRVRRLKRLGLTISLSPGYRLSRRGESFWDD